MFEASLRHSVGKRGTVLPASPMVVGELPAQDSDIKALEESEVKIPISHHVELLIKGPNPGIRTSPEDKRNRCERIFKGSTEEADTQAG